MSLIILLFAKKNNVKSYKKCNYFIKINNGTEGILQIITKK